MWLWRYCTHTLGQHLKSECGCEDTGHTRSALEVRVWLWRYCTHSRSALEDRMWLWRYCTHTHTQTHTHSQHLRTECGCARGRRIESCHVQFVLEKNGWTTSIITGMQEKEHSKSINFLLMKFWIRDWIAQRDCYPLGCGHHFLMTVQHNSGCLTVQHPQSWSAGARIAGNATLHLHVQQCVQVCKNSFVCYLLTYHWVSLQVLAEEYKQPNKI